MPKNRKKQDELTTEMHAEFIGDEITRYDLRVMGVYGAMSRGMTKAEALAKYDLTEQFYDTNINRVLNS